MLNFKDFVGGGTTDHGYGGGIGTHDIDLNEAKEVNMYSELSKIAVHLDKASNMADKLYQKVFRADSGDKHMEKVAVNVKKDLEKWADNASRIARQFK